MKLPIYLDYAATTPVDLHVAKKMMNFLTIDGNFGNPASRSHCFGWHAEEYVNISRYQIAELINCDPREIIFTSGATESNNLAIKGIAKLYELQGKNILTSKIEHKSVLDSCKYLELEGFKVTYLNPNMNGLIIPDLIESHLTTNTILVSIIHVNNEIGVIQDIQTIGEICHKRNIFFHVDATQSIGKLPIDLNLLKIDLMSFSAHKIYGPKGIGVLYVHKKLHNKLRAQIHGGGHERGMRSGTLPVHQIVGMGEACNIAHQSCETERAHIQMLRNRFWNGINIIDDVSINGNIDYIIPNILNVNFKNIDNETLIIALKDLAVSSGSACNSANLEPSYVLTALGLNKQSVHNSIRFSFGRFTTENDIDYAISLIKKTINILRTESSFKM
ncbi:MAG: IscS subfamily cysteine desulfurase [Pantoea sp. Brub]|nr:IscS subfamily cysteine desulfurase [Pantoea sp. Brub]